MDWFHIVMRLTVTGQIAIIHADLKMGLQSIQYLIADTRLHELAAGEWRTDFRRLLSEFSASEEGTMSDTRGDVTVLLAQLRAGKKDVADQLVPLVYNELRRIAGAQIRRERPGHTLQATAVVHEAYMRLSGEREIEWHNRAHFFGIAGRIMRQVLLDYARQRHAGKRGGEAAKKVDLDAELMIDDERLEDIVAMDELLARLSEFDPQHARIAELRYFAGLNVEETAEAMGTSATTVKREWRLARAWLQRELSGRHRDESGALARG